MTRFQFECRTSIEAEESFDLFFSSIWFKRSSTGRTPVPLPSTGTTYRWIFPIQLYVNSPNNTTATSNWRISQASSLPTGVTLGFRVGHAYVAPENTTPLSDAGSGPLLSGFTPLTTTPQEISASSYIPTEDVFLDVPLFEVLLAVDDTYIGGAGELTLPAIVLTYSETNVVDGSGDQTRSIPTNVLISDPTNSLNPIILNEVKLEYELRDLFDAQ